MNKDLQALLVLIFGCGILIAAFFVGKIPQPVPKPNPTPIPVSKVVEDITKIVKTKEDGINDAHLIGQTLIAASNLFEIDKSRTNPYYSNSEQIKWAVNRTGEISMGYGYVMDEKYSGLSNIMSDYMTSNTSADTPDAIIASLKNLGEAFLEVK